MGEGAWPDGLSWASRSLRGPGEGGGGAPHTPNPMTAPWGDPECL